MKNTAPYQKGFMQVVILVLLLVGILAGTYLVQTKTNFFPKAAMIQPISGPIIITSIPRPISRPITPTSTPTPTPFVCTACAADIDKNGRVDTPDYVLFVKCYGKSFSTILPSGQSCAKADINGDTKIDNKDYICLQSKYLQKCVIPTPTPSQSGYYLEYLPSRNVLMTPTQKYSVFALLKDMSGNIVIDQKDVLYSWSVDQFGQTAIATISPFSECNVSGISPCSQGHATITVLPNRPYSATNIRVKVTKSVTQKTITEGTFYLNIVPDEDFVYFQSLSPSGGEVFKVGQSVQVKWGLSGDKKVDYYNLYYIYYKDGILKGGYIGSEKYGINSKSWIIPDELKGQQVKVSIDASKGGVIVGSRASDNYFTVSNNYPIPTTIIVTPTPILKLFK